MASQLFSVRSNSVAKALVIGIPTVLVLGILAAYGLYFSPFNTDVGTPLNQPVPFSHNHHVAGLGIDCRYCHTSVEVSSSAGIPPTETCMTCHSQVWRDAPVLAPVRESWTTQRPIRWRRVHDLPDYVFFNHSIHVAKGVACTSCHGRVQQMPLMAKGSSLFMRWCLDCHRHPETQIRPPSQVYKEEFKAEVPEDSGEALVKSLNIVRPRLSDCSICHR